MKLLLRDRRGRRLGGGVEERFDRPGRGAEHGFEVGVWCL